MGGKVILAISLTRTSRATEAEPILHECLEFAKVNRLEGNAANDYVTSALGECLLAQKRYPEAETLLLFGYEHLKKDRGEKGRNRRIDSRPLHRLEQTRTGGTLSRKSCRTTSSHS